MTYRIRLPSKADVSRLDIIDPFTTASQRSIRREGLAGFEPNTSAALLSLFESADPGFVFYDVGANVGIYAAMAAEIFRPRAVHAFEPMPSTADVMDKIAAANGLSVNVHRVALSDVDGVAPLYLSPVSDASNSMVAGFRQAIGEVEVPTRRLDDCVREFGDVPDIIKIDVETFEPQVIAGGLDTIRRHRPTIVVEVLYRRNRNLGTPIQELMDGLGYSYYPLVADFDGVAHDRMTGIRGTDRDWLLTPAPVDPAFVAQWRLWRSRVLDCTPGSNPRPPLFKSAQLAYQRGGARELMAASQRRLSELIRRSSDRPG